MYFRFNQDKKTKRANNLTALFFNFFNSVTIAVMCYALSNVVLILFLDKDIDVVSLNYALIFVGVFAALFICFSIYYFKAKKGISIDEEKITISMGYFGRNHMLHDSYDISDIERAEYIEKYRCYKDLKRISEEFDLGVRWFVHAQEYGVAMKNKPVIAICIKGAFGNHVCFLSCEDNKRLIESLNSRIR